MCIAYYTNTYKHIYLFHGIAVDLFVGKTRKTLQVKVAMKVTMISTFSIEGHFRHQDNSQIFAHKMLST